MTKCRYCEDTGTVTMTSAHDYTTSFACTCSKGETVATGMGIQRWRGTASQRCWGSEFKLLYTDILKGDDNAEN